MVFDPSSGPASAPRIIPWKLVCSSSGCGREMSEAARVIGKPWLWYCECRYCGYIFVFEPPIMPGNMAAIPPVNHSKRYKKEGSA